MIFFLQKNVNNYNKRKNSGSLPPMVPKKNAYCDDTFRWTIPLDMKMKDYGDVVR